MPQGMTAAHNKVIDGVSLLAVAIEFSRATRAGTRCGTLVRAIISRRNIGRGSRIGNPI